MKIIIAEHFGMCFGVRDAIAHAERLAAEAPLTILGALVHNPIVRERLQAVGAREKADDSELNGRVMITAHGTSNRRRAELRASGVVAADATCPLVRRAHQQLKALVHVGYFPVVIGKRGHVEVRGLTEDFGDAFVIEAEEQIRDLPDAPRYGVISQTTQPIEFVHDIVVALRAARPNAEVKFCDTVCQPTKDRQRALKTLLDRCDTIVVVGGRNSNNTLQLVHASAAAGRRVVHIERAEELRADSFRGTQMAGITAGTSTLPETVSAVVRRLEEISRVAPNENEQTAKT